MSYFANVSPESVDIRGKGITSFLHAVKAHGLELHSLKIIRHGKCCASAWAAPYGPEYLHPVYSFSKSLTAAAIGFACQEGLLSLDDKIVDIFPEYCPEEPSAYLKEVTLHHLLTMSCGQETEIDTEKPTWIEDFLHHDFLHKPGTWYQYNTAGTNMLSAALTKKTGMALLDFLRPRLLDPLGIDQIACHVMPDALHTHHGGGGMKLTTEGMARFAYFMLHDGVWEGKQLLSGWYKEKAGVKQIETAGDAEGHVKEWANGYGYQCWMGSLPRSFRADGAYGQFGFVFPTLDMIVVTTSATEQTQTLVDCMYDHLIPAVCPDGTLKDEPETSLTAALSHMRIPALLSCRYPKGEEAVSAGCWYAQESEDGSQMNSFETLIGGAGLFALPEETSITAMRFTFTDRQVIWTVVDGGVEKEIKAALDGRFDISQVGGYSYGATARWRGVQALEMEVRRLDAISGVRMIFRFDGDEMRIEADETLMTAGGLGMYEKHLVRFVQE